MISRRKGNSQNMDERRATAALCGVALRKSDKVGAAVLRTGRFVLRAIPYTWRVRMFGAMAEAGIKRLTSYRARILNNLDYVWPGLPSAERDSIAREVANNFGKLVVEHLSMGEIDLRMRSVAPSGAGLPALHAAIVEQRPVVLVSGHFGNYEAARLCLLNMGCNLGAIFRPIANPALNRIYLDCIVRVEEGPLFAQDRPGMAGLLRHLKGGGAVMILNDLYVGKGIDIEFLGRPAMTSLSAAELALKFKAPLIPFYGIREPDDLGFRVELEAPIPPTDARTMTAALNRSLAARIERNPGQWFWIHRRWKRRSDDGAKVPGGLHPAALPRGKSNKLLDAPDRRSMRP